MVVIFARRSKACHTSARLDLQAFAIPRRDSFQPLATYPGMPSLLSQSVAILGSLSDCGTRRSTRAAFGQPSGGRRRIAEASRMNAGDHGSGCPGALPSSRVRVTNSGGSRSSRIDPNGRCRIGIDGQPKAIIQRACQQPRFQTFPVKPLRRRPCVRAIWTARRQKRPPQFHPTCVVTSGEIHADLRVFLGRTVRCVTCLNHRRDF